MNYNNVSHDSLNEKIVSFRFFLAILFAALLLITACNAVSGAYSDDPYGPVVNCDANLPMNELLKCVDKEYALMDKINEPDDVKRRKIFFKMIKNTYNLPSEYKEIDVFPKLKNSKLYDRERNRNRVSHLRIDTYNDITMTIYQQPGIGEIITYKQISPVKKPARPSYMLIAAPSIATPKYTRDYYAASKDILITKDRGRNKIYTASYEIVPLKNNQALYVIAIVNYCQHKFTSEEIQFAKKTGFFPQRDGRINYGKSIEAQTKTFDDCGKKYIYFTDALNKSIEFTEYKKISPEEQSNAPYSSFKATHYMKFVEYEQYPHKIINLSADRRENPKRIYVNLNNRTFEVNINQQVGNDAVIFGSRGNKMMLTVNGCVFPLAILKLL